MSAPCPRLPQLPAWCASLRHHHGLPTIAMQTVAQCHVIEPEIDPAGTGGHHRD